MDKRYNNLAGYLRPEYVAFAFCIIHIYLLFTFSGSEAKPSLK